MKLRLPFIYFFLFCSIPFFSSGQIVVSTVSPANAANVVLNTFLAPSGVMPGSVQNVTFTGVPGALATFTGTSNVGFTEGIILSSDNANYIPNPAGTQISGPSTTVGDPQLQSIASGTVQDAAVLQFDFQPLTDTLRFRYVFGSEEYPEYVCSGFNDVFGFFISGPNPTGANYSNYYLARIPGTYLPVSIYSINPGVPGAAAGGGNCSGPNQSLAYSSLYTANSGITIIFDGMTHVLEAKVAVKICGTYHIKLAVGNCNDQIFDSGVFLEAHSFGGGFVPVYSSGGTSAGTDSLFICPGDTITLTAANSQEYNWGIYGTTQSIQVTQPGTYQMLAHDATYSCVQMNLPFHILGSTPYAHINPVGPITLCPGDSVKLTANRDSAYLWSPGGFTSQSIWASAAGNYVVTVTDSAGCGDTISNIVSVLSGAAAAVITPSASINLCPGGNVTLTANPGIGYLWSNGATTQSILVSNAATYTVTVYQTACSATSPSISTTVGVPIAAIAASGPTTFCQPGNVTLSANTGVGFTYLWSNSSTTSSISVNATGNYTVTVTNSGGCSAVSTVTSVNVNSATASITNSGNNLICQGDSVLLTANTGGGYLWSNGATTQNIYVNQTGIFTVVVTNLNTCVATSSPENITVSQPIANITYVGNTTICPNSSIQLNANSGASYLWSNAATAQSINVGSAGGYVVTVTNADNCTATAALTIGVSNPVAVIIPVGNTTFCDGDSVRLNANNGTSYLWSNGLTTQNITVLQAGNYTVTVTDNWGCDAVSTSQNVIVNSAVASIALSGDTLLCPNEQVTLTANTGSGYLWSNGSTAPSINVTQNGQYNVTVTNTNGCVAISSPVTILVSQPTANITAFGNVNICPNASLNIGANSGTAWLWSNGATTQNINVNGNGSYSVTVTNNDNCSAVSSSLTTFQSNPTAVITPQGATTFCIGSQVILSANAGIAYVWSNGATTASISAYNAGNYSVTVTNADTCIVTSSAQSIVVNSASASVQVNGNTSFCEGDSVLITSANAVAYNWSNGLTTPSIYASQTGNYYVVITDVNGCTAASNTIPVNVHPYPVIAFITDSTRDCNTLKVEFINQTITEPNSVYFWNFGDGQTAFTVSPIHTFDSLGTYNVVLIVNSPYGCKSSDSVEIILQGIPEPIAKFITTPEAGTSLFGSEIKFINQSQNAIKYYWNFGDNSGSSDENPVHAYKDPGVYTIVLESSNLGGCRDYFEIQFPVAPFYIPSAFTPNNDGKNETFPSLNYGLDVQSFEMSIWNRWGMKVFVTSNPQEPFTGHDLSGNPVQSGVYYYRFDMITGSGKPYKYEGTVNLLR